MSACTHVAAGRRPRGHEDAVGRPQNNKGHGAARREKRKRKRTNTSPEGSRKEVWLLLLQKEKKKTLPSVFCSSYKGLSKRARPPLHHASALVCSSHPVRWRVPPEKPSLLHPHTVVLKKRKPSYNESGLLQANRGLRGRGWRDGVGRWSGKEREEFGERIQG